MIGAIAVIIVATLGIQAPSMGLAFLADQDQYPEHSEQDKFIQHRRLPPRLKL